MFNYKTKNHLFFRLSLCLLPFFSPISLVGSFLFSIKSTFDSNISLNTYLKTLNLTYPCILLTLFTCLASCMGASNKLEAFAVSMNFIPFFLLFFAVFNTFDTYKFKQFLTCILISSIPVILLAIIEFLFNQYGYYDVSRFISQDFQIRHSGSSSVFNNSNFLAGYLVILLGLSLGILVGYNKKYCNYLNLLGNLSESQSLFLIKTYVCFNILAIVCSQSRNGLLVSLVMICSYAVICNKSKNSLYFAVCLLVLITSFFYSEKYINEIRYLSGELSLTPSMAREIFTFATDSRTEIWGIAVSLGKQRPFLGWGLGNYKLLYPVQSIGIPNHPHNLWLMLFVETGIMGLVSFNVFVGHILCQSFRRMHLINKEEKSILISCLMPFFASVVFHFFDCPLFDARINCLNWIFLAGIFSLSRRAPQHNTALEPTHER